MKREIKQQIEKIISEEFDVPSSNKDPHNSIGDFIQYVRDNFPANEFEELKGTSSYNNMLYYYGPAGVNFVVMNQEHDWLLFVFNIEIARDTERTFRWFNYVANRFFRGSEVHVEVKEPASTHPHLDDEEDERVKYIPGHETINPFNQRAVSKCM